LAKHKGPNINVVVTPKLLHLVQKKCAAEKLSQKEFVSLALRAAVWDRVWEKKQVEEPDEPVTIEQIAEAAETKREFRVPECYEVREVVNAPSVGAAHRFKTCTIYGCQLCKATGFKDASRGI